MHGCLVHETPLEKLYELLHLKNSHHGRKEMTLSAGSCLALVSISPTGHCTLSPSLPHFGLLHLQNAPQSQGKPVSQQAGASLLPTAACSLMGHRAGPAASASAETGKPCGRKQKAGGEDCRVKLYVTYGLGVAMTMGPAG